MVSTPRLESADDGDANHLEPCALLPLPGQSRLRGAWRSPPVAFQDPGAAPHHRRGPDRDRGVLAGRHAMRSLLMTGFLLVAVGIVAAQPPGRWLFGATGRGTARWTEDGAGLTYRGGGAFGWAVLPETSLRDGFVQARFKPIAGREDQAGGVVWRWRDADNYYVARANALEDNVVAYKVVAGRRTALAPVGTPAGTYGVKTKVAGGAWHTLRADFSGSEFTVLFDGQRLFSVRDDTFAEAGKVGIWSKADSVTEFERPQHGDKS